MAAPCDVHIEDLEAVEKTLAQDDYDETINLLSLLQDSGNDGEFPLQIACSNKL